MRGASFANALLSSASFTGADVAGAVFEGALLSSSDTKLLCANPTLDEDGQMALGCH